MITEAKRSGLLGHVALTLALAFGAGGCVASAADLEAQGETREDTAGDRGEHTDGVTDETANEGVGVGIAEETATGATAQPSTPDPAGTPQPSPWKPNGPGLLSASGSTEPNTPDPAGTPQPSPWDGHNPPPNGPNTQPSNVLSTQQN